MAGRNDKAVMGFGTLCYRCLPLIMGKRYEPGFLDPLPEIRCTHCGNATMSAIYVYVDAGKVDHPGYLRIKKP